MKVLDKVEQAYLKSEIPDFRVGDAVRVHFKIREGGKERVQVFAGTVIGRQGGGSSESFTVRRVAYGLGTERVFPLHSPRVAKIEIEGRGDVGRAKLYYLRDRVGKAARVKQKIRGKA